MVLLGSGALLERGPGEGDGEAPARSEQSGWGRVDGAFERALRNPRDARSRTCQARRVVWVRTAHELGCERPFAHGCCGNSCDHGGIALRRSAWILPVIGLSLAMAANSSLLDIRSVSYTHLRAH